MFAQCGSLIGVNFAESKLDKEIKTMTDNKDLKNTQQYLKTQLNTPQTQEVRYIETEDLYPDLGYEDISSSKGYGPCDKCKVSDKKFRLTMVLKNCMGSSITKTVNDTDAAADEAAKILTGSGDWQGTSDTGVFRDKNRKSLKKRISAKIAEHTKDEGETVIDTVVNNPDSDSEQ